MEKYSEDLLKIIEGLRIQADKNRLKKSLNKLSKNFNSWKKKGIDAETLASHIREWYFVNGENSGYTQGSDPGLPIAKALTEGYLKESDIPQELLLRLEMLIEILKV